MVVEFMLKNRSPHSGCANRYSHRYFSASTNVRDSPQSCESSGKMCPRVVALNIYTFQECSSISYMFQRVLFDSRIQLTLYNMQHMFIFSTNKKGKLHHYYVIFYAVIA